MRKSKLLGSYPLVEAAHFRGRQRPSVIVIRTSWTTSDKGAANGIAQAWHAPNSRDDSCHYVVDDAQTIRCLPDKIEATYLPPRYKGAITINMCYDPPKMPTLSSFNRASKLTARVCKAYHIPVRYLSDDMMHEWLDRKWRRRGGIILKTAGNFPSADFLASVQDAYRSL